MRSVRRLVTFDLGLQESHDVSDRSRLAALTARIIIDGRDYGVRGVVYSTARRHAMAETVSIEIDLVVLVSCETSASLDTTSPRSHEDLSYRSGNDRLSVGIRPGRRRRRTCSGLCALWEL